MNIRSGILVVWCLVVAAGTVSAFDHTHAAFAEVLDAYVQDGLVDYRGLQEQPETLRRYLRDVAMVSPEAFRSWDENRQIAFLVNLYNAQTLDLIIRHYPLPTIRDIGSIFTGPWGQRVVNLFGRITTLDTLEHKILRVNYQRPGIHFALVCAAMGCPPLRGEPYVGDRLDEQFRDQGKQFLAESSKNRLDAENGILYLSPIFKWFREDFEKQSGSVLAFIGEYLPMEQRKMLETESFRIRYTDYDWSLNDIPRTR